MARPRWKPPPARVRPASKTPGTLRPVDPPPELRLRRNVPLGRYPLLTVFRGLERTPGFRALPAPRAKAETTVSSAYVVLVPEDAWMYVAPRFTPDQIRRFGYEMVTSSQDVIVVGHRHLTQSPGLILYLDILHEFLHLIQRADGRELWDPKVEYVDRSTEIESYRHSVGEARRLGVSDEFLRDYLQVEWVSPRSFDRLLVHLAVAPRPRSEPARSPPAGRPGR